MKFAAASFLSLVCLFTLSLSGCGGAPESDPAADQAAQELHNDPDYEKQMLQHTQGAND